MENRDRIGHPVMLRCFAAGAVVLAQGMTAQAPLAQAQSVQAQSVQSAQQIQPVAYRGSGRIDVQ